MIPRFTRSRLLTGITPGSSRTVDYSVPAGKELSIFELFASTNLSLQKIEILYSTDNGTTWTNPWDTESGLILQLWIAAGVPSSGKPDNTWFIGGEGVLVRVKVTNLHPTTNSDVYFLVKGFEREI